MGCLKDSVRLQQLNSSSRSHAEHTRSVETADKAQKSFPDTNQGSVYEGQLPQAEVKDARLTAIAAELVKIVPEAPSVV